MERRTTPRNWVRVECAACGTTGGQNLEHYQVVRCGCGKYYWALQPKRNGPLVAYPWPGNQPLVSA